MTKKTTFTALLLLAIISFTSCGTIESLRPVNLKALSLGMSKEEVQAKLKKKPDNTIAASKDPKTNNVVEVLQYSENGGPSFWLYFVDNKLTKWEKASSWQQPQI